MGYMNTNLEIERAAWCIFASPDKVIDPNKFAADEFDAIMELVRYWTAQVDEFYLRV